MIKINLWDIINAREPKPRDGIPERLEKPETSVGKQAKAEDAKDAGDDPEARTPECGHRGDVPPSA